MVMGSCCRFFCSHLCCSCKASLSTDPCSSETSWLWMCCSPQCLDVELLCEKSQSSHIPASYICEFCCEFPRLWDRWIHVFLRRSKFLVVCRRLPHHLWNSVTEPRREAGRACKIELEVKFVIFKRC